MSSQVPEDLKYAKSHEWVRVQGNRARVGVSDHAQQELTDVVFVDLPSVGQQVTAGEACAVVESVKTASDIYSPVSGQVVAVNAALADQPGLVNTDPYEAGWFYEVELEGNDLPSDLLTPEAYREQIG